MSEALNEFDHLKDGDMVEITLTGKVSRGPGDMGIDIFGMDNNYLCNIGFIKRAFAMECEVISSNNGLEDGKYIARFFSDDPARAPEIVSVKDGEWYSYNGRFKLTKDPVQVIDGPLHSL